MTSKLIGVEYRYEQTNRTAGYYAGNLEYYFNCRAAKPALDYILNHSAMDSATVRRWNEDGVTYESRSIQWHRNPLEGISLPGTLTFIYEVTAMAPETSATPAGPLDICPCGHPVRDHTATPDVGGRPGCQRVNGLSYCGCSRTYGPDECECGHSLLEHTPTGCTRSVGAVRCSCTPAGGPASLPRVSDDTARASYLAQIEKRPYLMKAITRANAANLYKITDAHVEASRDLMTAAIEYINAVLDSFMIDDLGQFVSSVCEQWGRTTRLSAKQAAGLLNKARADYAYLTRKSAAKADAPTAPAEEEPAGGQDTRSPANGIYTVVYDESGAYRTLKIADSDMSDTAPGTRIISYLGGSDNEGDYYGLAFLTPRGDVKFWKKHQGAGSETLRHCAMTLVRSSKEEWVDMGKAYALVSGRCFICNRTLTTPASIEAGIGPTCAARIG